MDVYLVLITFPDEASARQIGTALVEMQLAACVNLIPAVQSIYRWQGKICQEAEVLGIVKTTRQAYPRMEDVVKSLHPYDCPEILAIEPSAGAEEYLEWVRTAVQLSE